MKISFLSARGNVRTGNRLASFGMLISLLRNGLSEPRYDGYQIWFFQDIPNYNDETKNLINQKFNIKNY